MDISMNTLTLIHQMLVEEEKKTDRACWKALRLVQKAQAEGRMEEAEYLRTIRSSVCKKHAYAEAALTDFVYHVWFSSFEVYEGPDDPAGKRKYVGSTPLWDQALTAVKNAAKRGKTYLILGVRDDGTHAWIDTWNY